MYLVKFSLKSYILKGVGFFWDLLGTRARAPEFGLNFKDFFPVLYEIFLLFLSPDGREPPAIIFGVYITKKFRFYVLKIIE